MGPALFVCLRFVTVSGSASERKLVVRDPAELSRTARAWRPALWVGVFSLLGSIGWAWAFTLESAAKVRTLGQAELIIAFVIAAATLGERHTRGVYAASGLVLAGVTIVAIAG